ncbi:MAG: TldD/PmbA family protein [Candidatus Bathyarchaeota archaeon]|nr:TldD/PmbA family protein [Candidatus Bathyarchaeota archaeon]
MEELLKFCINLALDMGSEYAEARFQSDFGESMILKNSVPEASFFTEEKGVTVRVLYKGSLGFACTNKIRKRETASAVKRAFKIARAASRLLKNEVSMEEAELGRDRVVVKPRVRFDSVDLDSKIQLMKEADERAVEAAKEAGADLTARMFTLDTLTTKKVVLTSDGADVTSVVPRAALSAFLTAHDPQRGTVQRSFNLGESAGWEAVERWNLPELMREESSSLAKTLRKAVSAPKGVMDVVLGPEVVGIVSHESSGHPGEADRILGREAAQAGETYLKMDSLGMRVGSDAVNVADDPTIDRSFGFYLYDEEGVKATKRVLIKEGRINEFLQNRESASVFGVHSNGASRASAYNREPIVRMANTFLEPGDYSKEELIEGVKDGVYIKNFMEWNIDDRRFNQRYVGLEAYRIENGELKERVRNPVLEMTTVGLWSAVDAVGKDLEFQAAYCGKSDPMQALPVWTGGPHARLRGVRLGSV